MLWIIDQAIILSLVALVLIALSPVTNRFIGAVATYKLWLLLPLSLGFNHLSTLYGVDIYGQLHQVPSVKASLVELANQQKFLTNLMVQSDVNETAGLIWLIVTSTLLTLYFVQSLNLVNFVAKLETRYEHNSLLAVRSSQSQHSPFLMGLFKPKIVLPIDFCSTYTLEQQQLILKHEETHFKQGDLFWNLLANALVITFWFNPILWLAYRRFRQQQELSCDETTTRACDEQRRLSYAKAILSTVWSNDKSPDVMTRINPLLTTHYGEKSSLKDRLLFLQHTKKHKRSRVLFTFSALTATILVVSASYHLVLEQVHNPLIAIKQVPPVFPKDAANKEVEGFVTLSFSVLDTGATDNIKVVESSHPELFHATAIAAIQQWRYESPNQQVDDIKIRLDFVLPKKPEEPAL